VSLPCDQLISAGSNHSSTPLSPYHFHSQRSLPLTQARPHSAIRLPLTERRIVGLHEFHFHSFRHYSRERTSQGSRTRRARCQVRKRRLARSRWCGSSRRMHSVGHCRLFTMLKGCLSTDTNGRTKCGHTRLTGPRYIPSGETPGYEQREGYTKWWCRGAVRKVR
jgi:hypothetical protein